MVQSFNWLSAILFSLVFWIIVLPLLLPIFLILGLYKSLVCLVMKILKPNCEILNSADSGLVDDLRKKTLYNLGFVFVVECDSCNSIKIEDLRSKFSELFLARGSSDKSFDRSGFRKLTQVYKSYGGYYFWENSPNFAIETQVSEYSIESESELSTFASKWMKYPYKQSGPLWSAALIKWGDHGGKKCAVAFRIHHALADGISVLQIVNRLTDVTEEKMIPPKTIGIFHKVMLFLVLPYLLKSFMDKLLSTPNPSAGMHPGDNSCHAFVSLNLEEVKGIKKKKNVPFATILMTIVGGMYRKLLQDNNTQGLPEYVYLGNALPWPYRKPDTLCNEWTFGAFKIPIAEVSVDKRIKITAQDFNEYIQDGSRFILKPVIFGLTGLIPSGIAHHFRGVNDTVTIAPSPIMSGSLAGNLNQEYRLLGGKIKHCYPIANNAVPHLALGAISTSHGVQMDVCLLADRNVFPNTQNLENFLMQTFQEEYQTLKTDTN